MNDPTPAGITPAEMTEAEAVIGHLPRDAARLLAVEILLADPVSLADDCLESCLYELRDRITEAQQSGGGPESGSAPAAGEQP